MGWLVGQRTEKPERGRVIALTVCGIGVLERPANAARKAFRTSE